MSEIKPFEISISQSVLDDLQDRLKNTRWADDRKDAGWNYGTNLEYLQDLSYYWQHKYDWRKYETEINKLKHFKANIDGTSIHFVHQESKKSDALPLLLLHGWPDSFYYFHKVIPLLSDFHIVVPSLPGFGFSDRIALSGDATAKIMANLMAKLGYKKYAVAGGDISTQTTMALAVLYPDAVKAIYLTQVNYPTGQEDLSSMTKAEKKFASSIQQWLFTQGAYVMVHSTKPQSVAQGLNDSPTGLASWMISFIDTASEDHQVEKAFGSRDELLTNVTIYWATQTINSANRTYLENVRATHMNPKPKFTQKSIVPASIGLFPRGEQFPGEWAERTLNVQRFTKLPRGGHFAALEEPQLYANDLQEAFQNYI